VISVSVCLSAVVSQKPYNRTSPNCCICACDRGSILLWRRCHGVLRFCAPLLRGIGMSAGAKSRRRGMQMVSERNVLCTRDLIADAMICLQSILILHGCSIVFQNVNQPVSRTLYVYVCLCCRCRPKCKKSKYHSQFRTKLDYLTTYLIDQHQIFRTGRLTGTGRPGGR